MTGVTGILDWARQKIAAQVPTADLDQRDPDYIRDQLPGLWLLASLYFRLIADRIAARQVGISLSESLKNLQRLVESSGR